MKTEVIPVVIIVGALGTVKKGMIENIKKISEPATVTVACSRLRDDGGKSFSNKKCEKRAGAGETGRRSLYACF